MDIAYDANGLRQAAGRHGEAMAACRGLAAHLMGCTTDRAVFGAVPAADHFHAVLTGVHAGQSGDVVAELARRDALSGRTGATATQADQLTGDTASAARAGSGMRAT